MLQWSFFLNERVLIASLIGTSAAETGEEIGFFFEDIDALAYCYDDDVIGDTE